MAKYLSCSRYMAALWLIMASILFSSCYSYRIVTLAQAGTETVKPVTTHSFLWGLVRSPKEIHTPVCDSLGANGMAEVNIKNNFGFALITVATLGIWSPMKVECKCAKPCKKTGIL